MTERQKGRKASAIVALCFMAYTFSYIGRQNLSACLPEMISGGYLSITSGGTVSTVYMIIYALGQLVFGAVCRRYPPRRLVGIGLFGAGLANLSIGILGMNTSPDSPAFLPLLILLWGLNGASHSMLWSPIIGVITGYMPEERRFRAGTTLALTVPLGSLIAYFLPALLLNYTGWQTVFLVCGGLILTASVIFQVSHFGFVGYIARCDADRVTREQAPVGPDVSEKAESRDAKSMSFGRLLIVFGLWTIIPCLVLNGSLKDAVITWIPTLLCNKFSLDASASSLISALVPAFSVSGTYLANFIYKKIVKNEMGTTAVLFGIAALCFVTAKIAGGLNPLLCCALLAVSIATMLGANHIMLTVLPIQFADFNMSATLTGFLNFCIYFGCFAFTQLYAIIADKFGWDILLFIWLGAGLVGCALSLLSARFVKTPRTAAQSTAAQK